MPKWKKDKDSTVRMINTQVDACMESLMKDALRSEIWASLSLKASALYPAVLFLATEAGVVFAEKSALTDLSGLVAKNIDKALEDLEAAQLLTWDRDVQGGFVRLTLPVAGHYHPDGWL